IRRFLGVAALIVVADGVAVWLVSPSGTNTAGAGIPGPADIPPDTLLPVFDASASEWPGGPAALTEALAHAAPATAPRVLATLQAHHPDRAVANAAAHARKTVRPTRH
ncbi:hypothetical protein ACWD6S_21910, partial [Streptomyces zhihengii]